MASFCFKIGLPTVFYFPFFPFMAPASHLVFKPTPILLFSNPSSLASPCCPLRVCSSSELSWSRLPKLPCCWGISNCTLLPLSPSQGCQPLGRTWASLELQLLSDYRVRFPQNKWILWRVDPWRCTPRRSLPSPSLLLIPQVFPNQELKTISPPPHQWSGRTWQL